MASRNDTPDTPDVSETELRSLKIDEHGNARLTPYGRTLMCRRVRRKSDL
jgi:hypothetical protein